MSKLNKLLEDFDNYRMPERFSSISRQKEIFFNAARKYDKIQIQKRASKLILLFIWGTIILVLLLFYILLSGLGAL